MKKLIKRLLLAILLPALLLGFVEKCLRLFQVGHPTPFLVSRDIDGQQVFVDNPFFGYRFFPERMTRTPAPIKLQHPKPPGVIRIAVLGESAAMGEPQPEFGLARILEMMLGERFPGRRVEVINAAMTAINSHVIREIAGDLARVQPDVFVIYMGNNEVAGPFGPGTVFEPFSHLHGVSRARVLASRLRIAQALRRLVTRWSPANARQQPWTGMEMFTDRQVAAEDPRLERVYAQCAANLDGILRTARRAGAAVVLSTVAVNLRDCPPFAPGVATSPADHAGQRDQDRLRFRADSRINRLIREAAARHSNTVAFVDADALFGAASPGGAPGGEFFLDHVHFNFDGNVFLASKLLVAISARSVFSGARQGATPTAEECARVLLRTGWEELDLAEIMIARRAQFPFPGQAGNESRLLALVRTRSELAGRLAEDDTASLENRYDAAMRLYPEDWRYPANWGEILLRQKEFSRAEDPLRRACALLPHRLDLRGRLAYALASSGRAEEALLELRGAETGRSHLLTEILLDTARNLARDGHVQEALRFSEEAVRHAPASADAKLELGARWVALGRMQEAERVFRDAADQHPIHPAALGEWAIFLTLGDRWDEARPLFERLRRVDEGPEGRLKYAAALIYRGEAGEAERELSALIEDHPGIGPAYVQWGTLCLKRQDWPAAQSNLEQAVRFAPADPRARAALALAFRAQGQTEEAQRQEEWARALEGTSMTSHR